MPKLKNLAVLAAAVEAGRRYARSNPDKAGKYLDQASAFLDKQTKGKYSRQIEGAFSKVKGVAGLPQTSRAAQGFEANAGYGRPEGYGRTTPVSPSATTPSTDNPGTSTLSGTTAATSVPPVTTPPTSATVDPQGTGEPHFPGSKDV